MTYTPEQMEALADDIDDVIHDDLLRKAAASLLRQGASAVRELAELKAKPALTREGLVSILKAHWLDGGSIDGKRPIEETVNALIASGVQVSDAPSGT